MKKLVALLCLTSAALLPVTGCIPVATALITQAIDSTIYAPSEKIPLGDVSSSGLTGGDLPPCPGSYGESA